MQEKGGRRWKATGLIIIFLGRAHRGLHLVSFGTISLGPKPLASLHSKRESKHTPSENPLFLEVHVFGLRIPNSTIGFFKLTFSQQYMSYEPWAISRLSLEPNRHTPMGSEENPILSKLKLPSRGSSHLQIKIDHFFSFLLFVVGLSLGIIVIYITSFWYVRVNAPTPARMEVLIRSVPDHHDLRGQGHSLFSSRFLGAGAGTIDHEIAPVTKEKVSRMHNMSDDELLSRAAMAQGKGFSDGSLVPKVAFMFLTHRAVHLSLVWEKFFGGHQGFYSIYWHAHPSYVDSMPVDSVFYGTRIPSQVSFCSPAANASLLLQTLE